MARLRLSSPISSYKIIVASAVQRLLNFVLEMGLEPISLAAFDFESNVYTIPPLQRHKNIAVFHLQSKSAYATMAPYGIQK